MTSPSLQLDFDKLSDDLGGFGKFQCLIVLLASFSSFLGGVMVAVPVFSSTVLKYRCKIPSCDTDTSSYSELFLNFTTPWNPNSHQWTECHHYSTVASKEHDCSASTFNTSLIVPCSEWVYEKDLFYRTPMSQFDLTCKKLWMVSMGTSSYMIGMFVGSIMIGYISDKFGRRVGLYVSTILVCFGAVATAFSPFYEMLLIMRAITGAGGMGCFQVAFVIAIEYVGPKHRTACGIFINIPFAMGECFLGLLAYLIRDWRFLQVAALSPAILFIFNYMYMPESILWLVNQRRNEEAFQIIQTVAKVNGRNIPQTILTTSTNNNEIETNKKLVNKSFTYLMKSKIMLRRSFILFYCWITATIVYFGLSAYGSNLSENIFLNYTALVLVEIPSYIASIYFIDKMGRKGWHMLVFILAALGCIISPLLPQDQKLLVLCTNLVGKFGASAAFGSIFLYTGELYPTECRASGIGACSMSARIGGIIAPFINSLKIIFSPLPAFIYGILSLFAGFLILLLPETCGSELPQSLEECEQFGRDQNLLYIKCCENKRQKPKDLL